MGLKDNKSWPVEELFKTVKSSVQSVWAWNTEGVGNWEVYLPQYSDKGKAYAEEKGFLLLTELAPTKGFWVNTSNATPQFPPMPLELRVLHRLGYRLYSLAGARVYVNEALKGETNQDGLVKVESTEEVSVTIKKDGFEDKNLKLKLSQARTHTVIEKIQEVEPPEPGQEGQEFALAKTIVSKPFVEYPNLFIMEATLAEAAKPTSKYIR